MNPDEYNQRELEQGRLTFEQLQILCDYTDLGSLKANLQNGSLKWSAITEAVKVFQTRQGLTPDGMAGEATRGRIRGLAPAPAPAPLTWVSYDGPAVRQPRNRAEVIQMFGDPGTVVENKEWSRKNLVECHEKLGNRLPGVPAKWWVSIHRVVEPYLREALRRVQIADPNFVIEVLGSHNWRPIRNKPGNPLSMHAWGLAVDLTPAINRAVDVPRGKAPEAWTPEWDKLFPPDPRRVSHAVVEAFRSCGYAWGSDWNENWHTADETWLDSQHFEWIARDGKATNV